MRPETFGTTLVVTIYTVACSSMAACRRPANSFVAAAAAHMRRHSIRHTSMLVAVLSAPCLIVPGTERQPTRGTRRPTGVFDRRAGVKGIAAVPARALSFDTLLASR